MYQNAIRDRIFQALDKKVKEQDYGKYLYSMNIKRLRGLTNQIITFDFPVTALIGINGSGKSTIFGAAALVYQDIQPRLFFPKSGKLDDSMQGSEIEYSLIHKSTDPKNLVKRKVYFKNLKWERGKEGKKSGKYGGIPFRENVYYAGISRTIPASEIVELSAYRSARYEYDITNTQQISQKVAEEGMRILGKDVSKHAQIAVDTRTRKYMLKGETPEGVTYSEFHFGAGESSIIRMITDIELLPENSLILIEEIENGLHPIATIRLVEYLIEVANRKKIQVIFTTHSNDSLKPLPNNAIWGVFDRKLYQGKLDIHSLRTLGFDTSTQLAIFVEDGFSKAWVQGIVNHLPNVAKQHIEIHAAAEVKEKGNDNLAVVMNKNHNSNPSKKFPSICLLDGDSKESEEVEYKIYKLPGNMPEKEVIEKILANKRSSANHLLSALHLPTSDAETIFAKANLVWKSNRDPHIYFGELANELGLTEEITVLKAFVYAWVSISQDQINEIASKFQPFLPTEKKDSPS